MKHPRASIQYARTTDRREGGAEQAAMLIADTLNELAKECCDECAARLRERAVTELLPHAYPNKSA